MQAIMVTLIFIILSLSFLYGYESFFKASFYKDMGHPLSYISPPPVLKFQKKTGYFFKKKNSDDFKNEYHSVI